MFWQPKNYVFGERELNFVLPRTFFCLFSSLFRDFQKINFLRKKFNCQLKKYARHKSGDFTSFSLVILIKRTLKRESIGKFRLYSVNKKQSNSHENESSVSPLTPLRSVGSFQRLYFTNSAQKRSCHRRASATGSSFCMTAKTRSLPLRV